MKHLKSMILSLACLSVIVLSPGYAQEKPSKLLTLAKDASGSLTQTALNLSLRSQAACDQTESIFPDGSQLVATDLSFITNENNAGLVSGSVQLQAADGQVLQTLMLRGTWGLNLRHEAGQNCRVEHLEALLEPVPTFAPVNLPQIALAHLSADIIPESAGPLPLYRARLDGFVTLPPTMNNDVTINADKNTYNDNDAIALVVTNPTNQPIITYDLKSYCSIVRLQRQTEEGWEDIAPCRLRRRSFRVTIGAGETQRVTLPTEENAGELRKPGTYRLVFDYVVGTDAASEGRQIVSPLFRIKQKD